MLKKTYSIFITIVLCIGLVSCGQKDNEVSAADVKVKKRGDVQSTQVQFSLPEQGITTAVLSTDLGDITMVIFNELAPQAAENFIGLAKSGYYDGQEFYRVINDFLIQTGDATGTGGNTIWNNIAFPVEFTGKLRHYSGAIGMVHPEGKTGENMSQFYIIATPQGSINKQIEDELRKNGASEDVINTYKLAGGAPELDNKYTVFGQITEGMEIVDKICAAKTEGEAPIEKVKLNSITVK